MVHGGAWNIPEHELEAHRHGVLRAAQAGYALLRQSASALDAVEAAGGKVAFVLALVDRQEGGRENIEKRGHKLVSFFTRTDVLRPPRHAAGHA